MEGEEGWTKLSDLGWYERYVQGWKRGLALHGHCLDVLWMLLDGLLVFVFLLKLKPAWTGEFTYLSGIWRAGFRLTMLHVE